MSKAVAVAVAVPAPPPLVLTEQDLQDAEDRIVKARTHLMRDQVWYGNLTLRLRTMATLTITPTMATDGTWMLYNPLFVQGADDDLLKFACAHEVLHAALLHPYRIGKRNLKLANIAADYIVNEHLAKSGFTVPTWAHRDMRFDGMYFEQVYAILEKEQQEAGGDGDPDEDFDQGGEFLIAPPDNTPAPSDGKGKGEGDGEQQPKEGQANAPQKRMTATDWQIAVEEASMLARKAGTMPGELDAYINGARASTVDWRSMLRQFFDYISPNDFAWSSPNRTYLAFGYVFPGVKRESLPRIGITIDTSGSIYQELLDIFGEEVQSIVCECRPECVEVVYCDTQVNNVEEFTPDDVIEFHPKGRGGTCFQPALDHFAENPPAGMLYFTDLENSDNRLEEPGYPVLWVTPDNVSSTPEFGEVIRVSKY